MAITVEEKLGQALGSESGDREYVIKGTTNAGAARTELLSTAPSSWEGKVRDDVRVEEINGFDGFLGIVTYKKSVTNVTPETNETFLRLTTGGGSTHVYTSKGTIPFPNTASTPRFGNAIGVAGDGTVAGVDVLDKNFTFDVVAYHTNAQVTNAYLTKLFTLSTTVNNAKVKVVAGDRELTFDAGALMFVSADVVDRNGDDWEIIYHFSAKPNKTGQTVAGITGVAWKGHEYIWTYHEEVDDADLKRTIQKPQAVYVEQIYDETALTGLLVVEAVAPPPE